MSDPRRAAEKAAKRQAAEAAYQQAVAGLEFRPWPKIARLNREVVITEKIDGTNAAVGVIREVISTGGAPDYPVLKDRYRVYAQSRTQIITPERDNMGFARWVQEHADVLARTLGEGLHFGEWWGQGIQRGYGLSERRFSLFNTERWEDDPAGASALVTARNLGVNIYAVPVLYRGPWTGFDPSRLFNRFVPDVLIDHLVVNGSAAATGFMKPEGIVVYHKASGVCFKVTVEKDEEWKGSRP